MTRTGRLRPGPGLTLVLVLMLAGAAACADLETDTAPPTDSPASSTSTTAEISDTPAPTRADRGSGVRVVSVTDGDTLVVRLRSGAEETVRLTGINTPEAGECLADEAAAALRRLVGDGPVRLEADTSDRDQYGRLLRYLFAGDTFVNARLVETGLALSRAYEPDTGRQDQLDAAQQRARAARRGQWAPDACGPAAGAPVRIVAVEADAPGDDNENLNGEWVTVANTGNRPLDLTGWGLRDESASHRYTFPAGFRLGPGARVRVRTGCGRDTTTDLHWCEQGSAVWNNSGDTAFLSDPRGNTVDARSY